MRNRHVKISGALYDKLVKIASVDDGIDPDEIDDEGHDVNLYDEYSPSDLWMLGANKQGVIVRAEKLTEFDCGGCETMPAIDSDDLSKIYLKLARARLTAVGYALTVTVGQREGFDTNIWDYHEGKQFFNTPGCLLIEFSPTSEGRVWNERAQATQKVIIHKVRIAK